jgi:hypothetical protein
MGRLSFLCRLFPREQRKGRALSRVRSSAKWFAAADIKEIVMFRKTLIAALTVATVAGSAIIAPTTASAGYYGYQSYGYHDRGYSNSYCFQKPITKYDYYTGRLVVVGYTMVCR